MPDTIPTVSWALRLQALGMGVAEEVGQGASGTRVAPAELLAAEPAAPDTAASEVAVLTVDKSAVRWEDTLAVVASDNSGRTSDTAGQ